MSSRVRLEVAEVSACQWYSHKCPELLAYGGAWVVELEEDSDSERDLKLVFGRML